MNLTDAQKQYLVPASTGAAAFVLADEIFLKGARKKMPKQALYVGAAAAALSAFLYGRLSAEDRAKVDSFSIPMGAAAGTFIAVNRFAMPKLKPGVDARPYAAGAAALAAWYVNKDVSPSPVVGRLAERTFKPPFPPPFGPPFPPEFEG